MSLVSGARALRGLPRILGHGMTKPLKCVFLYEMGHIGPYFHRGHAQHGHSPLFGFAGFIIDDTELRGFCSDMVGIKRTFFADETEKLGVNVARYERKSADTFNAKALTKFPIAKTIGFRFLNKIKNRKGQLFYIGREKKRGTLSINPMGLYTTVLTDAIKTLDAMFDDMGCNWCLFLDDHSSAELIVIASEKTMFGNNPVSRLIHPPFLVNSEASQGVQAADWVAGIVGRLWTYRLSKAKFADHEIVETYFQNRINDLSIQSKVTSRKQEK
jgi:Protein of unknown function (DUF3800)